MEMDASDNSSQLKETMYCPKCGNNLSDNSMYCPKCGEKVEIASSWHSYPAEPTRGFQPMPGKRGVLKPKERTNAVYMSAAIMIIFGVIIFLVGQQLVSTYSGTPWYEPYESKAQLGTLIEIFGGIFCLGGVLTIVRFFMNKDIDKTSDRTAFKTCPQCQTRLTSMTKVCPKCGKQLDGKE